MLPRNVQDGFKQWAVQSGLKAGDTIVITKAAPRLFVFSLNHSSAAGGSSEQCGPAAAPLVGAKRARPDVGSADA